MSQENVEIVRRVHEAWAVRDAEAAFEALAEDAELDERNAVRTEMLGVYRGRTEIEAVLRHQMEVFDEWQVEALEIIDAGDQVVVHVRITGGQGKRCLGGRDPCASLGASRRAGNSMHPFPKQG